jgi:hypothetical protein
MQERLMEANLSDLSSLEQEAIDECTPGDRLCELARSSTQLARLVANNPSAPPELLQELTNGIYGSDATTYENNRDIYKAVAQNPNTPPNLLLALYADFPLQVLNNPVLDLLVLENPNFLDRLCQTSYNSVFQEDGLPFFFLERAIRHPNDFVRIAVANSPATPQFFLEQLAQDREVDVRCAVAANYNTPKRILEQLAKDSDRHVRLSVANNPYTPPSLNGSLLEQLALDEMIYIRRTIAENYNTPASTLERLAQDWDAKVRRAVAENPNTPISALKQLVQDDDSLICLAAAKNLVSLLEEPAPF